MRQLLEKSIVRFLIVGCVSLGIDYGLLLLLHYWLGVNIVLATTTAYLVGLLANFGLNKLWSFRSVGGAKKTVVQAVLYGLLVAINIVLVNAIVVTASSFDIGPELSKPIATALLLGMNYFAYKTIIFKQDNSKDSIQ